MKLFQPYIRGKSHAHRKRRNVYRTERILLRKGYRHNKLLSSWKKLFKYCFNINYFMHKLVSRHKEYGGCWGLQCNWKRKAQDSNEWQRLREVVCFTGLRKESMTHTWRPGLHCISNLVNGGCDWVCKVKTVRDHMGHALESDGTKLGMLLCWFIFLCNMLLFKFITCCKSLRCLYKVN